MIYICNPCKDSAHKLTNKQHVSADLDGTDLLALTDNAHNQDCEDTAQLILNEEKTLSLCDMCEKDIQPEHEVACDTCSKIIHRVCAITGKEDEMMCIGCYGIMKQDVLE